MVLAKLCGSLRIIKEMLHLNVWIAETVKISVFSRLCHISWISFSKIVQLIYRYIQTKYLEQFETGYGIFRKKSAEYSVILCSPESGERDSLVVFCANFIRSQLLCVLRKRQAPFKARLLFDLNCDIHVDFYVVLVRSLTLLPQFISIHPILTGCDSEFQN